MEFDRSETQKEKPSLDSFLLKQQKFYFIVPVKD